MADFRTVRRVAFEADPQGAMRELAVLGFPVFIKPANAGSSVGIRKVSGSEELAAAIRHAFSFDSKVIVEAAVTARELELAVLGGEPPTVSVAGEIVVRHPDGFYSYDAKYLDPEGARLGRPGRHRAGADGRSGRRSRCGCSPCSSARAWRGSTCFSPPLAGCW